MRIQESLFAKTGFYILINRFQVHKRLPYVVMVMIFALKYSHLKIICMKNMQGTTPAFVLTSLSFKQIENKTTTQQQWQPNMEHRSTIAKFDYCLPPEELNGTEQKNHFPFD
jgi:hypothetical protein